MLHIIMGLLVLVSGFFTTTSSWVPEPDAYEHAAESGERCSFVYQFAEGAETPFGVTSITPARVLLAEAFSLEGGDIHDVQARWMEDCAEYHAEIADVLPDRTDTLEITVDHSFSGVAVDSWSLHTIDSLASMNANYETLHIVFDRLTGERLALSDLVSSAELPAAQAALEAYAMGPYGVAYDAGDSGVLPTGFMNDMSVGYSQDGITIFGWLPEALGTFPLAVTVPWEEVDDFRWTL